MLKEQETSIYLGLTYRRLENDEAVGSVISWKLDEKTGELIGSDGTKMTIDEFRQALIDLEFQQTNAH